MKFAFGAGERRSEGFVHHDARPLAGIDLVHEWRTDSVLPLATGAVDEIFLALDVLEHFDRSEQHAVLADWARVCKSGCALILCVPDLERTARRLIDVMQAYPNFPNAELGDQIWWQEEIIRHLYCIQDHPWNHHKWGFTRRTVTDTLGRYGFAVERIVDGSHFGNMVVYARRTP